MLSKIIVCLLEGLIFCLIFYLLDKNKSKYRLINLIFIYLVGAIGAYIAYRLEWHFGSYFPEFNYSVVCSASFASFENIINYIGVDISGLIRRGFTAVPHHICFAIIMGFLIGLGKFKNKLFYILGLIIPILVHAISNWFIYKPGMFDSSIYYINYFILICISIYICIDVRKKE